MHRLIELVQDGGRTDGLPRVLIAEAARDVLSAHRSELAGSTSVVSEATLVERIERRLAGATRPALPRIVNATGIIIHTGLGRAPLADEAVRAAADAAAGYVPLEVDLVTGERGRRTDLVRRMLVRLTGAESATVVNNNAAALLLSLSTLARGRSVIVSRGELIEIGGSFRLPEVMAMSGAHLREVGTTNRTRLSDYEQAVDESTGALLKAHPSNYRVEGFTSSVSIEDLAELGRRRGIPVIHDVGSGRLCAAAAIEPLPAEPAVADSVSAGADLVLFSGDKLLGGPQAGIVVGRGSLVDALERNPMMRALRVDKIILAALDATLRLHLDGRQAETRVPVMQLLGTPVSTLQQRAQDLLEHLRDLSPSCDLTIEPSSGYLGGGSLPTHAVPGVAVVARPRRCSERELGRRLRSGDPAVMPRIGDGAVWLDLRTVLPTQDQHLARAMREALTGPGPDGSGWESNPPGT